MLGWLALTRLPAMSAANMDPQEGARTSELAAKLPASVQSKADNYNHLLEQPTIFYVTCLVMAIAGLGDGLNLTLAWVYVGSRVIHSVVQATVNQVPLRFGIFMIGTISLIVMVIHAIVQLTG
jgi:hypothetical protein